MKLNETEKIKETYHQLNNLVQNFEFKSSSKKEIELLNRSNLNAVKNKDILKNLKNIKKLFFNELEVDIQTLGFYIVGKVIENPVNFGRLNCMIQDENGDIITIIFYKCTSELSKIIKKGCLIIIFDPLYSVFLDSSKGVKLEDEVEYERFVVLNKEELYEEIFKEKLEFKEKKENLDNFNLKFKLKLNVSKEERIEELKNEGNNCMKSENYFKACEYYTHALELDKENVLILSNRAEALIKIGCYNKAIEDCKLVLKIDPSHKKSIFRIARSLEQIGQYNMAKEYYTTLIAEYEGSEDLKNIFNNLKERRKNLESKTENSQGKFNLVSMFEQENMKENSNYEFKFEGYFSKKISFSFSTEKGIHLIANETIQESELLMVEKPIIYINYDAYNRIRKQPDNKIEFEGFNKDDKFNEVFNYFDNYSDVYRYLSTKLQEKLVYEETLKENINQLYFSENKTINIDERNNIFDKKFQDNKSGIILDIIYSNSLLSMRNSNDTYKNICYGLWKNISYLNHSCLPNSFYFGIGPYLILRSISKIEKDEEISISYCEPKPYSERKFSLSKWGFECKCSLCEDEKKIFNTKYYKFIVKKLEKIKEYIKSLNLKDVENFHFDSIRDEEIIKKSTKWIEKIVLVDDIPQYYFIKFIFFKNVSKLLISQKQLSLFCFEKSISFIINKSFREFFEILVQYYINLKDEIYELRRKEIKFLLEKYCKKLFTSEEDSIRYIMKY